MKLTDWVPMFFVLWFLSSWKITFSIRRNERDRILPFEYLIRLLNWEINTIAVVKPFKKKKWFALLYLLRNKVISHLKLKVIIIWTFNLNVTQLQILLSFFLEMIFLTVKVVPRSSEDSWIPFRCFRFSVSLCVRMWVSILDTLGPSLSSFLFPFSSYSPYKNIIIFLSNFWKLHDR